MTATATGLEILSVKSLGMQCRIVDGAYVSKLENNEDNPLPGEGVTPLSRR